MSTLSSDVVGHEQVNMCSRTLSVTIPNACVTNNLNNNNDHNSRCTRRWFRDGLFLCGFHVQKNGGKVSFLGLLMLISLSVPLKNVTIESNIERLWVQGTCTIYWFPPPFPSIFICQHMWRVRETLTFNTSYISGLNNDAWRGLRIEKEPLRIRRMLLTATQTIHPFTCHRHHHTNL